MARTTCVGRYILIAAALTVTHYLEMRSDPFQWESSRERLAGIAIVSLLFALVVAVLLLEYSYVFHPAEPFDATVLNVSTLPDKYVGDAPILTVRLKDGSIRQVITSWNSVKWCTPGSTVSLVANGAGFRVGLRGCARRREAITAV